MKKHRNSLADPTVSSEQRDDARTGSNQRETAKHAVAGTKPGKLNPTAEAYSELQQAYEHFNLHLYGGELPNCLITFQREKQTFGYFSKERFVNNDGTKTDEIALNPSWFAVVPLVEIMQTLVHEMAHLWQAHFGDPGRGRYHNEEWANKMETIGLMPSSTGRPGGKRTGDRIADYAIPNGKFLQACQTLFTQAFRVSWFDRFPAQSQVLAGQQIESINVDPVFGGGSVAVDSAAVRTSIMVQQEQPGSPENKSNRVKYSCACDIHVWGKPGLALLCKQCGTDFL
jgi:predicted SprT family Zn-dependent metalloprotease